MVQKILYVEDEYEIRTDMQRWLVGEGYQITCCANEAEFKAALSQESFDLLLLDRQIPGSEGLETDSLKALRQARRDGLAVPAICMTAKFTETDDMIAGQTGNLCQDYILKPVNKELLRTKMANFLAPLQNDSHLIRKGRWLLDIEARSLRVGGDTVSLSVTELTTFRKLFDKLDPTRPEGLRWVVTSQWSDLVGHHEDPHASLRARIKQLRARLKGTAGEGGIEMRKKIGDREGGYALVS